MKYRGILKENATLFKGAQYLLDWFAILVSSFISYLLYIPKTESPELYVLAVAISITLSIFIFSRFGLYQVWRGLSLTDEIKALISSWGVIVISLMAIAFISKAGALYSRVWFILWIILGLVTLISFRMILRGVLRWMRRKGYNQRHIVLVGDLEFANTVAERLNFSSWMGLSIHGVFIDGVQFNNENTNLRILGNTSDLNDYVEKNGIDQVWLTMALRDEDKVHDILHDLRNTTVDIRFVPDIFGLRLLNHSIMEMAGLPIINLAVTPMSGANRLLKELEDKILSLIILIIISPLMLSLALFVKLSSPGPIFYRQERIGWNGQKFNILKFRSMPVDSEKDGIEWGAKNKPATTFGAFIRKTSLDELPQFINVLKGDMSIVGPRPERTVFVEELKDEIPGYMKKHLVKAGITGWAQVNGWRGDTDLNKRIEYDLYYIENWSLWFDIKIIFMTIFKGFINKNAY